MLATPSVTPGVPPSGDEWMHEVKWDGVRVMAEIRGGRITLYNRTEGEVTATYPELTRSAARLPSDLHVDGEVIAFNADGLPSFQSVGHRMHVKNRSRAEQLAVTHPVTFMVFDVVRHDDRVQVRTPWRERRALLEELDLPSLTRGKWQVPAAHHDGAALATATAEQRLEGVVSKRHNSFYRPGLRSPDWIKAAHRTELVAVIGGWVPQADAAHHLGSVWIGHPTDEATFHDSGLLYPIARVGSGLRLSDRSSLLTVLGDIRRETCPFEPRPNAPEVRRTSWVEPAICVQVRYLGTTDAGTLRQPVMRALRPDVTPLEAPYARLLDVRD